MSHLTLINTFGAADANCYSSLSEANSYMVTKFNSDDWTSLTDPQKEAALLTATRQVDAKSWRGDRFFYNQSLQFPRTLATSLVGPGRTIIQSPTQFDVEYGRQEQGTRDACCEQALFLARIKRDRHLDRIAQGVTSYSETVPGYSESYQYGTHMGLCPEALQALREWRAPARLVRA